MATYFSNCSSDLNNFNLCIKHNVSGFPNTGYNSGDLIYLIVQKGKNWKLGARGFLGNPTDFKPWPDSEKYKSAFKIDWELIEEKDITEGLRRIYHPNFGLAIQGKKDLDAFLNKGDEIKEYLNGFFSKQTIRQIQRMDLSYKQILEHINRFISSKGFKYEFEEIANFYLSLKAKPFVILAGISGTGKTQLPRQFAAALGLNENLKQVPVRPDWTDGSDLLGYTDLGGNFIPKDLSNLIIEAEKDPDYPYFFILDEMNLARVEHYFSDYLSIIETRTRNGNSIVTDPIIREEILNNAQNSAVFRGKGLPENLYLIGTVNMDETTHAFSRKVLDRANSIEMNEVNLGWDNSQTEKTEALSGIGNDFLKTEYLSAYELSQEDKDSIKTEIELLIQINEILKRADLHFAYRVRDEIAFYLILNKKYNLMTQVRALDFQLVQKILPRIHGSSERIQKILIDLLYLLEKDSKPSENKYNNFEAIYDDFKDKFKYSRSANKILFMLKRFDEDRFTSFWL